MGKLKASPDQILRRVRFAPYRVGMGPTFALTLWDTYRAMYCGGFAKDRLGYRLTMREPGKSPVLLFEGEDYGSAPGHSLDSDATVSGIMTFLTLRPGDTDPDYFANYTDAQRAYCSAHAEILSSEVSARYSCFVCGGDAAHTRTVDGYARRVCSSHGKAHHAAR